jgi:hypothetical protein
LALVDALKRNPNFTVCSSSPNAPALDGASVGMNPAEDPCMEPMMRLAICMSLLLIHTAAPAMVTAQSRQHRKPGCGVHFLGEWPAPTIEQLQGWAREYYPDLVAKAKAPARLVVGFLLDDTCRVLRHSVGVLPFAGSDSIVIALFPGVARPGTNSGIGDAVTRDTTQPWGQQTRLLATWQVQITRQKAAEIARERARFRKMFP